LPRSFSLRSRLAGAIVMSAMRTSAEIIGRHRFARSLGATVLGEFRSGPEELGAKVSVIVILPASQGLATAVRRAQVPLPRRSGSGRVLPQRDSDNAANEIDDPGLPLPEFPAGNLKSMLLYKSVLLHVRQHQRVGPTARVQRYAGSWREVGFLAVGEDRYESWYCAGPRPIWCRWFVHSCGGGSRTFCTAGPARPDEHRR